MIEPGVKVLFTGAYGLTVGENAKLTAQGNEAQPIEFTAWNREAGWGGLRFVDSGGDDVLRHCLISYAKKDAGLDPAGAIRAMVSEADSSDGGDLLCDLRPDHRELPDHEQHRRQGRGDLLHRRARPSSATR